MLFCTYTRRKYSRIIRVLHFVLISSTATFCQKMWGFHHTDSLALLITNQKVWLHFEHPSCKIVIGFVLSSLGFQRPIHMYIKAKDETTTSLVPSLPCPHSAMSCTSETGRLKSVVQVVSTQPHAQLAHVQGTKSTEQQN